MTTAHARWMTKRWGRRVVPTICTLNAKRRAGIAGTHDLRETETMTDIGANIAAALVALQAEAPKVHKGKTARIPGKNGGQGYTYKYADLSDVAEAAKPLLAKHGLAFICQPGPSEKGWALHGSLVHVSGERVTGSLPLSGGNAQAVGSDLTYHRRYLLGCLTGIVTDEDDDGAAGAYGDRSPRYVEPEPPQETPLDTALRGIQETEGNPDARARVLAWADAQGLTAQLRERGAVA